MIFYKLLRSYLENRGFVVNTYDHCVVNKMVDGAQNTVFWHVDDLKISHMDKGMVNAFVIEMANIYRAKTTISRGRVYDYLGMKLDFVFYQLHLLYP